MNKKIKNFLYIFFSDLFFISATSLVFSVPWGLKNYPLHLTWNVFFVLASDTSGHDSGTARSIIFGFVIPTIAVYLLYCIVRYFLYKKNIKINIKKMFFANLIYFSVFLLVLICSTRLWSYFFIYKEVTSEPKSSAFYKENFLNYDDSVIIVPENKRNLIMIFLESMEPCYSDVEHGGVFKENLIPNLTKYGMNNINFSDSDLLGGGFNFAGTSWTVAGILSKMAAVPYFNPFKKYNGKLTCLKNAYTLNDYLAEQDYVQFFSMGSEKQFENRDLFLEDHHVEIHDIKWYKENKMIPEDYQVFWGFEDSKLYSMAKIELENLSNQSKPFFFGMLTVDTHFPYGYVCDECKNELDSQMKNVVRCADNQVGKFLDWIQNQEWFSNTTVVILGDHAYLDAPLNNFITEQGILPKKVINSKRRFINIIINPVEELKEIKQKNRCYSSFDIMPTILEALGNKFSKKGIGLGRSLFSDSETLVEKYGVEKLEKETMKNVIEYNKLK